MPSFDVVSEIDSHELTNAVDQASRELSQRFDFKNTGAEFELDYLHTDTAEAYLTLAALVADGFARPRQSVAGAAPGAPLS